MRVAIAAALMGLFVMTATAGAPISGVESQGTQDVIVVFNDEVDDPAQVAADLTGAHGGQFGFVYEHAIKGFSGTFSSRAVAALERNPQVAYVELDQEVSIVAQTIPTGIERIFADQNGNIDIDSVDDERVDVDVAVIDTGIDFEHTDLNVVGGVECSGSPFSASCSEGGDDDHYHGTHVAGTIAALDNDFGVVGVAPGARLWAVKVLDSNGSGWNSEVIAGVDWVTANAGTIEVANMSLGGGNSQALCDAIGESVGAGVAYGVAAGNSDDDAHNYSPANCGSVLTVSALADFDGEPGGEGSPTCREDQDDTLADFSNWGDAVDIAAPGVCILSTYPIEEGEYGTISGTSMASPHAAGALALLASADNPGNATDVDNLYDEVVNNGNFDWTDDSGDGIQEPLLDVSNTTVFVPVMVAGSESGTGDPPSASIVSPEDGSEVTGNVTIQVDASDAEDDIGTLTVEVSIDGGNYAQTSYNETSGYYELGWDTTTVDDGSHTIDARATDSDGNTTDAAQVTVTTENTDDPPTVSIVNPEDGSEVTGNVTIQVDASDAEDDTGTLTVEVSIDGENYAQTSYNETSGYYEFDWDTTTVDDGSHTIDARATDSDGNTTDAAQVTVTVNKSVSYVVGLAGSSINNGSSWTAVVTITVTDSSDKPLEGVVVDGTWSNGASGSASCTTVSDGTCSVDKGGIHKRVSSVTFTVDTVEETTDFGGDSSITVSKP